MNVHQVISTTPGTVKYRDISCFCQLAKGVWDCPYYELQEATFMMENTVEKNNASVPSRPDVIGNHHSGRWCVLSYDEDLFPGVILDVEEHNIKVKCMHRNGINKFYWPGPREDVNWYDDSQIVCFIPEPRPVNRRSVEIDPMTWRYLETRM